jgi:hypothetical protein
MEASMVAFQKSDSDSDWELLQDDALIEYALQRVRQGFAAPPRIYRIEYRHRIDWTRFPAWARPVDPQQFDGCCHEG